MFQSKYASKVKELEADLKIEKSSNKRKNNEFDCGQSAKVQQTISDAFSRAQPVSQGLQKPHIYKLFL